MNIHGLDTDYFRPCLTKIADDMHAYTPYELYMSLSRLLDLIKEGTLSNDPYRKDVGVNQ